MQALIWAEETQPPSLYYTGPRVENNTLSQNRSFQESKLKELRPFSYRT